jgi:hypothetical protein
VASSRLDFSCLLDNRILEAHMVVAYVHGLMDDNFACHIVSAQGTMKFTKVAVSSRAVETMFQDGSSNHYF